MAPTNGEILRTKREEKQLSLLQVSQGTNIRLPFLQALEEDRLDAIPSLAQARGFTRLYAGYLGLDPAPLLKVEPKIEETESIDNAIKPAPAALDLHPVALPKVTEYLQKNLEKIVDKIPGKKEAAEKKQGEPGLPGSGASLKGDRAASQILLNEIGRQLESQREALGLSRADVERQTRIREYYLEALETGNLENLPSTVQGRGMLGMYASFMNLDPDSLQLRFAEALQQRRIELAEVEESGTPSVVSGRLPRRKAPAWKKFVTPDLIVSGGLFILLFVFVAWGAAQVIKTSTVQPLVSPDSISEILLNTETAMVPGSGTGTPEITTITPQVTSAIGGAVTQTSIGSGPIQVVVIIRQRTYLRITVDGDVELDQRVVPGNVYTFSASKSIQLLTGDGSAVQVIYNQEDLGVMGGSGEVVNINFTLDGAITPTPRFTATPTATQPATLTPQPTATVPLPTATPPAVNP